MPRKVSEPTPVELLDELIAPFRESPEESPEPSADRPVASDVSIEITESGCGYDHDGWVL